MPTLTLNQSLLIAGVFTAVLCVVLILWVDVPVALFFNDYREAPWRNFFAAITDLANGLIWYPLALAGIAFAAYRHRGHMPHHPRFQQELRAWLFMIATMASSGILINAMKFSIGRQRPRFLYLEGTHEFHPFAQRIADSSFPSGHTQSIWTAMLSLYFIFPPLRPLFILIALMISASRFIIGAHYLGDVTASVFIAFATVLLWRRWFERNGVSVTLYQPQ